MIKNNINLEGQNLFFNQIGGIEGLETLNTTLTSNDLIISTVNINSKKDFILKLEDNNKHKLEFIKSYQNDINKKEWH